VLPGIAVGAELALALEAPRLPSFVLLAQAYLPREDASRGDAGATLTTQRLGLEVCPRLISGSHLAVDGCVGQRLGRYGADGFGFDRNSSAVRTHHALAAGLDLGLSVFPGCDLSGGARLEVPLTRDEFAAQSAENGKVVLFRATPVAFVLRAGAAVHF
jgi:hypothetical protein